MKIFFVRARRVTLRVEPQIGPLGQAMVILVNITLLAVPNNLALYSNRSFTPKNLSRNLFRHFIVVEIEEDQLLTER